jgi:hypothetical protein
MEFLREWLGDGSRRQAAEVIREAAKLGISDKRLRTARRKLGVKTEKTGFGRGWEWWIPSTSEGAHAS